MMVVIAPAKIKEFIQEYPLSKSVWDDWYIKTKNADWRNFAEVRQTFNTCDAIGDKRFVFDIAGNNYRLVAVVLFNMRTVFIHKIMARADYDRHNKNGTLGIL